MDEPSTDLVPASVEPSVTPSELSEQPLAILDPSTPDQQPSQLMVPFQPDEEIGRIASEVARQLNDQLALRDGRQIVQPQINITCKLF